MFFKKQLYLSVVSRDNGNLFITCDKYIIKDKFVVFTKGSFFTKTQPNPTPFKEFLMHTDMIASISSV